MSLRTSANRYAKALFDVALAEHADLAQIDRDLASVCEMMAEHAALLSAATGHGVPEPARMAVVDALAVRLGVTAPVRKLLVVLASARKLDRVPDLADAYRERLLAHQNIVRAAVTSAVSLSAETTKALQDRLSTVTGKQVDLSVSVDAGLIGGLVATIGSTVYDGSVRTQLKKLRESLKA
jgi:F-type H+-transporting ATPase subunit delta